MPDQRGEETRNHAEFPWRGLIALAGAGAVCAWSATGEPERVSMFIPATAVALVILAAHCVRNQRAPALPVSAAFGNLFFFLQPTALLFTVPSGGHIMPVVWLFLLNLIAIAFSALMIIATLISASKGAGYRTLALAAVLGCSPVFVLVGSLRLMASLKGVHLVD